jgi:tagatose-1,6-bisphosphate aldolase
MTLDALTNDLRRFGVFAIDHRDSLRAFVRPDAPESLTPQEISDLKIQMISAIAPLATGVMLEPEYSIPQALDAGAVPPEMGFTAALESQGYLGNPEAGPTTLLEGYSVEQAKASGAACAKLLLPYRPDRPLAEAQERVGREVVAECNRVGIPVVLEPLFYGSMDPSERAGIVMTTAARFAAIGPDLLKLPFPVDPSDPDEDHWFASCRAISELCTMPWVVLSGGGAFEDYEKQVKVAVSAGGSGYMVGRALWGEAALAPADERQGLLDGLVRDRMRRLRTIID